MRKIIVGKNDAGQTLLKFLSKYLKTMPKSLLYKAIRKKRIKINGRSGKGETVLTENDVLELYINDEFFEKKEKTFLENPHLNIVYEDRNILIIDKPSAMVLHDSGKDEKTLVFMVQSYLFNKGEYDPEKEHSFSPAFCNRIDKNTRGIVIAAKTAEALREMNKRIKNREIRKLYLCTVSAVPEIKEGEIETYLKKNAAENKVYICKKDEKGAMYAKTKYKVLKEEGNIAYVEAELLTGRTHQIRAHLAYIGCPITGDVKYGAPKNNKKEYQNLTSYKIIFNFKDNEGPLSYLNGKEFSIIQK